VKDTVVRRVIDVSNNAQAAYYKNIANTSQPEPILGNNSDSVNIAAHENDYPLSTTDATLSAVSTVRNSGDNQSFAATAKEDMHKFDEINRASHQMKKRNQNRYVVGDSVMNAPFAGVSKKVFVIVSRLQPDISVEMMTNFLSSKNIKVVSCYKYTDKYDRFSLMRLCVSHSSEKRMFDPKLWPDGVIVRPWVFKSRHEEQSAGK